jgi:hypothetical protein
MLEFLSGRRPASYLTVNVCCGNRIYLLFMKNTLGAFVRSSLLATLALAMLVVGGNAQGVTRKDLSPAEIDRIIKAFTSKEAEFREALTGYVFNRSATIHTLAPLGGYVTGTYRRDSFMSLTKDGQRMEKVLFMPVSTVHAGMITPEDLEDLGGVNAFALEPKYANQYNFNYVGLEKIDDLNLYVFDVTPKVMPDPKKTKMRLFTGRVWVDVDDLMIVKSRGKGVPETKKNKFPIVETTRQQIDGKYWFPVDARADDELVFDDGVLKLRMRVKFTNYSVGRTDVRILEADEEVKEQPAKPLPTPTPTPKF